MPRDSGGDDQSQKERLLALRLRGGTNYVIEWAPAHTKTSKYCHEFLPCCNEILTGITVWIEKLDFIDDEN
jgi:hypothetical protein